MAGVTTKGDLMGNDSGLVIDLPTGGTALTLQVIAENDFGASPAATVAVVQGSVPSAPTEVDSTIPKADRARIAAVAVGFILFAAGWLLRPTPPKDEAAVRKVDLLANLQAIAPVDEHAGHLLQCDAESGGTCEPRQPGQSRVMRRDIFALMRIGTRHKKPVQSGFAKRRPQRRQSRCACRWIGGFREVLEHQPTFRRLPRPVFRGSLSNSDASWSVIAPASCSASVIVTARL